MQRRTLIGGGLGVAGLAAFAYRAAPGFFRLVAKDLTRSVEPSPRRPEIANWPQTGLHAAWIGHSTVAISIDGFRIVTDPVFSSRIGIGLGPVTVGLKRLVDPAISVDQLPAPDLILLSHAHMDHFDLPSLRKLENRNVAVITAANTTDLLRVGRYGEVHELKWDDAVQIGPARIRAFEVRHWGARMRSDFYRSYNGYVIEAGRYRVLFGGDTAYTEKFRHVRSSKPFDLAIMPIGAYDPWIHAHCTPEQAVAMANQAGAERILPVHHRTFQLSREPLTEPLERLLQSAGDRVCLRSVGEEFHLA